MEWRACKAEDEVKRLKMENAELQRMVAAGVQPEVKDPTLKGAPPEFSCLVEFKHSRVYSLERKCILGHKPKFAIS